MNCRRPVLVAFASVTTFLALIAVSDPPQGLAGPLDVSPAQTPYGGALGESIPLNPGFLPTAGLVVGPDLPQAQALQTQTVLGADDRQRVSPTTKSPPWGAAVLVEVQFLGGFDSCSGFLIGPRLVATAGHCVYDTRKGGPILAARVTPGKDSEYQPLGSQLVVSAFAPNEWVNDGDPKMDFGAMELPDNTFSNAIGWFSYGAFIDGDLEGLLETANIAGYPAVEPVPYECLEEQTLGFPACQLWFHSGDIASASFQEQIKCPPLPDPCEVIQKGLINYRIDTSQGQSGAPVWLYNGAQRLVVGIHTAGWGDSRCDANVGEVNCGTLITPYAALHFESWGAAAHLDPIFNLPPIPGPYISEDPPRPDVLLIHGWRDSCNSGSMDALDDYLTGFGHKVGRFCYNASMDGGILAGMKLAQHIESLRRLPDDLFLDYQLDIVAHSFGGLVSRFYIEKWTGQSRVRNLVMLGTPNNGTYPFNLWCSASPTDLAACDGRLNSPFMALLNGAFSTPSTQYKSIAGTGDHSPFWPNFVGFPDLVPNDCVVTVSSAAGPGFPTVEVPVKHSGSANLLCVGGTFAHLLNDTLDTFPEVLTSLPPFAASSAYRAVVAAQAIDDDVSPHTGMATDTATQGATNSHAADVDSTAAAAEFLLMWEGDSSLQLTLNKPDGTPINGSGPGITYFPNSPPGLDGLMMERYSVDAPDAGQWTMNVEGITMSPEGQSYQVIAFLNSDVILSFSTDKNPYLVNDPIEMTAELAQGGTPIPGAAVTTTVDLPDLTSQQITLHDDGLSGDPVANDGSYFATFTSTQLCGFYQVQVSALGTAGASAFTREEIALVDVRQPGDAVGDPCVGDEDGDGFSDDVEALSLGTDPGRWCPLTTVANDEDPDAWPLDFDDNRTVNIIDVLFFAPVITKKEGDPGFDPRFDLNVTRTINIVDVLYLAPFMTTSCATSG